MLEFYKQILSQIITEDGILLMGKGLGIEKIITHLLKLYCDPHQLVFILGLSRQEAEEYCLNLASMGVPYHLLPKIIDNEFNNKERKSIYLNGGCLFVTSRILIVDILNQERIPLDLVSGIIVCNCHNLTENCNEAFILRIFKSKNTKGFIKGFSENASEFIRGFSKLENILKIMFLRNIFLWPRFQYDICKNLEKYQPEVIEIHQSLTPSMKKIQDAIISIIIDSLNEIKSRNIGLDLSEFTIQNCLLKSFDKIIKSQLKPIWNNIGKQTKQMIEDLRTMRNLLL